jgi:hypothetical protein
MYIVKTHCKHCQNKLCKIRQEMYERKENKHSAGKALKKINIPQAKYVRKSSFQTKCKIISGQPSLPRDGLRSRRQGRIVPGRPVYCKMPLGCPKKVDNMSVISRDDFEQGGRSWPEAALRYPDVSPPIMPERNPRRARMS